MITLRRISAGVTQHFPQRVSEWLMIWPCIGMSVALNAQPDMFSTSPSFSHLMRWLSEGEWAFLVLMCGVVRLFALTINGTFDMFRYSPHLRIAAAFLSAGFWFQFTMGFASAAYDGVGALSAVVAYSTFVLAEGVNIYRASADLGRAMRR